MDQRDEEFCMGDLEHMAIKTDEWRELVEAFVLQWLH